MGKEKYQKIVENLFEKSPVINAKSIDRIIKNKKRIKQYTKQFIRNLIIKGKIKKLTKGCYTKHDDISLVVFCFKPAYLGLQDALSFHNLWEQETIPVIISTRKIRQGIRKVFNSNVLVKRINKRYLFGFEYYNQDNQGKIYLPYSDIEKTLIDMIYFKERLDKETIRNIKIKINQKKLNLYLKSYPKIFRKKILNALK